MHVIDKMNTTLMSIVGSRKSPIGMKLFIESEIDKSDFE